jgi:hypothetical protein
VTLLGAQAAVNVPGDDFSFGGNKATSAAIPAQYANHTLAQLFAQQVQEISQSTATTTDRKVTNTPASELFFRKEKEAVKLGELPFTPLMSPTLTGEAIAAAGIHPVIQPLVGDAQSDGYCVAVKLSEGFVKAGGPADLTGWTVEVGYQGPGGWAEAGSMKIDGKSSSKAALFELPVDNPTEAIAKNRSLEVRLRNDQGIPAGRIQIPFKELKWAA